MHHKSNRTDKPWSVGNVNIEIFEKKKKKKKVTVNNQKTGN